MTRAMTSLLTSSEPLTAASAKVTIGHIQLRDLVICPHERGIVCYPQQKVILEHDLLVPHAPPRRVTDLSFVANSLSTLILPDAGETLLAAGGQEAELHLSLYSPASSSHFDGDESVRVPAHYFGRQRWKSEVVLDGASINNSVLLTSLSLTGSNESSAEPRVVISNNDRTIKFFDIAVRSTRSNDCALKRLSPAGQLRLDVPVNHSSISPDGRTMLSVGDSPDIYLHRVTGGAHVTFTPMAKLSLAPYITTMSSYSYSNIYSPYHVNYPVPASFSTAFSSNGSKFAVASQEGVVVVWDVRSTKPLKVIQTDKSRTNGLSSRSSTGLASGWLYESQPPWDWGRGQGKAPGWGVRSVKFSPRGVGREVLTFTEHTSRFHVMDARTFEEEEVITVPYFESPPPSRPSTARPRSNSPPSIRTTVESSQSLPPSTRLVIFSGALEDTFRIPSADSTGRRSRRAGRRLRSRGDPSNTEDDADGIVVIPALGDSELDENVRRLLDGRHTMHPRMSNPGAGDERQEEEMDVDELESDCLSSHAPSRASSPGPSAPATSSQAQTQSSSTPWLESLRRNVGLAARPDNYREAMRSLMSRGASGAGPRRHRRGIIGDRFDEVDLDQDLAGTCFDPSGEYMYVAAATGVCEWKVRGAEQRWWTDSSLA